MQGTRALLSTPTVPPRRRSSRPILPLAVLALAATARGTPNSCIDDLTGRQNVCSAGDVAITQLRVLQVLDPCTGPGDTAIVLFRLRLEATTDRYDIGLFIAEDGGDARTGDCLHDDLPPPLEGLCCYDPTSGVGPFLDAEDAPGSGDECGDIEANVQTFYILRSAMQVECVDLDNDGKVDIGTCTSWDNNTGGLCLSAADAVPGTPSKCRCERINIVNLPAVNQAPSCSAGGPYTGGCRSALVDGATVTDPDEDGLTYVWQSSRSDVTLSPSSGTIPPSPGTRSVPPADAVLADTTDPCGASALLTLVVTDPVGNSTSCEATVSFDDQTAPLVAPPPDQTVSCESVPAPGTPVVSDGCDPSPTVSFSETRVDGSCPDRYTLQRTWTATDACGNTASATQTITVVDDTAPMLAGVPGNATVQCDAVPPPAKPTASDNCDPAPTVSFSETRSDGACPDSYTLTRTWKASDRCGNATSATQTVTVIDSTPPKLSGVPGNATVQCDAVPPPAKPTASDNCDPAPAVSFSETRSDGACPDSYTLTRTWKASDRCGNATSATQTVTVIDSTLPTLSGVPGNVTVQCDAVPPPAKPTASDNCDPAPAVSFSETRSDGACPDSYTLTRTWKATDRCGNATSATQTVTVIDSTPPKLSGVPGNVTVECDAVPPPASPTASDNCDPSPAISFNQVRIDGNCPDNYQLVRTWTARDRCNNSVTSTQVVTVHDTTPPLLSGVPGDLTVECGQIPPPGSPVASDNCDPAPAITFSEQQTPGNCPGNYVIVRTWTATDRCGNATSAQQTITVKDTTAPEVTPGSQNLYCMWPPNHWYICFTPDQFRPQVDDDCSDPVTWRFTGCASDQPDDAPDPAWPGWNGDGNTTDDCVVAPDGGWICVRSERCGIGPTAQAGRHYGVAIAATDACGNTSGDVVIGYLHVPHDQGPHERPCLDPTKVGCRPNQPIPCSPSK